VTEVTDTRAPEHTAARIVLARGRRPPPLFATR
jgi:hypothetical protein